MATISSSSRADRADRDARRRSLVLATCCLGVFMAGIDVTIVNVALPSIQRALHASVSGLQWTIDAYTLVIASLLMLSGSLADRFGRRRVFQIGLGVFSLGSLLCSLAPSLGWLIAMTESPRRDTLLGPNGLCTWPRTLLSSMVLNALRA